MAKPASLGRDCRLHTSMNCFSFLPEKIVDDKVAKLSPRGTGDSVRFVEALAWYKDYSIGSEKPKTG